MGRPEQILSGGIGDAGAVDHLDGVVDVGKIDGGIGGDDGELLGDGIDKEIGGKAFDIGAGDMAGYKKKSVDKTACDRRISHLSGGVYPVSIGGGAVGTVGDSARPHLYPIYWYLNQADPPAAQNHDGAWKRLTTMCFIIKFGYQYAIFLPCQLPRRSLPVDYNGGK
jgi:hypothetical protein